MRRSLEQRREHIVACKKCRVVIVGLNLDEARELVFAHANVTRPQHMAGRDVFRSTNDRLAGLIDRNSLRIGTLTSPHDRTAVLLVDPGTYSAILTNR